MFEEVLLFWPSWLPCNYDYYSASYINIKSIKLIGEVIIKLKEQ